MNEQAFADIVAELSIDAQKHLTSHTYRFDSYQRRHKRELTLINIAHGNPQSKRGADIHSRMHYPILQWSTESGWAAQKLYRRVEQTDSKAFYYGAQKRFYKIVKLPVKKREVYLLIGASQSDWETTSASFYTLEIKGDKLVEYPAFKHNKPILHALFKTLSKPQNYFNYNEKTHVLTFSQLRKEDIIIVPKGQTALSAYYLNPAKAKTYHLRFVDGQFIER